MRLAALDIGDVRIGLAVSDENEIIAQGIEVYTRKGEIDTDCKYIAERLKSIDAKTVVIGLPINMNGTRGPAVQKVEAFAEMLKSYSDIPQIFVDERLTTAYVQQTLIGADVSRKKRKSVIDKLAAQIILQNYLDTKGR